MHRHQLHHHGTDADTSKPVDKPAFRGTWLAYACVVGWPTLTTDQLVLRPLDTSDLDALVALHAEESFWRYPFGQGWTRPETESFLERTIERY